ncbi:MAG: DUF229 domain-containing protein [Gemmataceae bacterium]|nr:DUF229 domain-containing protein [Gemmataceae bacterium]
MNTIFLLALLLPGQTVVAQEKTNVLLIVADDLRVELGCYGSPGKTPNLDALAGRGVRFDRAYCQQALCNPSRSSFLTGKRPDTLRLWSNGLHFRQKNPDVVTLPQWFKSNGYDTRCVGKIFHNWHTQVKGDPGSWSKPEFLHYANHGDDTPMVSGKVPASSVAGIGRKYGQVEVCECRDVPDEAFFDGRVAAEAVKTLSEIKDQPFFLAVGFWKPHAPFNAPKKYWNLYDRDKLPPLRPDRPKGAPQFAFHDNREVLGIPPNQVTPNASQFAEMRHGYFANISYMDAQVGKVLKALQDNKLADKTLVVFVSDHGYHLGEHSLWAKTSCFELDARVAMIFAGPEKVARGKASTSLVELVDLFPTINELCGLKPPGKLDGVSLVPVLADPNRLVKDGAFTQHPRPAYFDRTEKGTPDSMGYSVRTANGRFTEWRDWKSGKVLAAEYYDHLRDPGELINQVDTPALEKERNSAKEILHRQFSRP